MGCFLRRKKAKNKKHQAQHPLLRLVKFLPNNEHYTTPAHLKNMVATKTTRSFLPVGEGAKNVITYHKKSQELIVRKLVKLVDYRTKLL